MINNFLRKLNSVFKVQNLIQKLQKLSMTPYKVHK